MSAWQSMDSAPKDGTQILIWDAEGLAAVVSWDGSGWWGSCSAYEQVDIDPIAWQAIAPPG